MKFVVEREALLPALQLVAGVVERRQTLPVLSNVLVIASAGTLTLTGTDLEVEMLGKISNVAISEEGSTTIPARKLVDICKTLPEGSPIQIEQEAESRVLVKSGRSRFTLSSLPASEFPNVEGGTPLAQFSVPQNTLRTLIEKTAFSMAQQDVRYYLNGMLMELTSSHMRMVATDGHRLAMVTHVMETGAKESHQIIVPRKGVIELSRLLADEDTEIQVVLGSSHIRVSTEHMVFTSKLVDGKFPDYNRVIPDLGEKQLVLNRDVAKQSFSRAAILSNEKYRGVRLQLETGLLKITANNPEQEVAEEELEVVYEGETLEIGFNVNYLVDALSAIKTDDVRFSLSDANSSALIQPPSSTDTTYVVMPMRL